MKKDYRLIALDLDGTLLSSALTITPKTERAIREAMAAGKEVVFSTGRSVSEIRHYLAPFPGMHYAICEAGACVYDLREEKAVAQRSFTTQEVTEIVNLLRGCDVMVSVYRDGWTFTNLADSSGMAHYRMADYAASFEESTVWQPDLLRVMPEAGRTYSKFVLFFHDEQERRSAWEALEKLPVCMVTCTRDNIELSPSGVDKGLGLRLLCERLGMPPEETIAVGDSENDLPILCLCGLPVAMGNAIPEVKECAGAVVADNDHDGVAEAIRRFLL